MGIHNSRGLLIHRDTPAKVVLIIFNTANMSLFTKIETPSITYEQPLGLYIDGKWVKGTEGYFIQPTIFSGVSPDMKIMQEEIFGPVCTISKFETEDEVIKAGNETTYGLAAAVHTRHLN